MDMNRILESLIRKYFGKRLFPGLAAVYERLQRKYGGETGVDGAAGGDGDSTQRAATENGDGQASGIGAAGHGGAQPGRAYQFASFGFQTAFMMRYMTMAFAAVCVLLVIVALAVNPEAWRGVGIFGGFLGLCLLLWLISRLQSGIVVYTKDWIYVDRPYKKMDFSFGQLTEMKVSGKLTLMMSEGCSGAGSGGVCRVVIPLEGAQYNDFMTFMENHFPDVVAKVPKAVYAKAKRKHGGSWGNRM